MVVNLNENGLESLLMTVLPNLGYEKNNEEVPNGCISLMEHLAKIPDWFTNQMKSRGYKECYSPIKGDYWCFVANQINMSYAGRCDIFMSFYAHPWQKNGDIRPFRKAVIFELKKNAIDAAAINQVLRYKKYVSLLNLYDEVEAVLIGTSIEDLQYINEYLDEGISFWTCNYSATGLEMTKQELKNKHEKGFDVLANRRYMLHQLHTYAAKRGGYDVREIPAVEVFASNDEIFQNMLK